MKILIVCISIILLASQKTRAEVQTEAGLSEVCENCANQKKIPEKIEIQLQQQAAVLKNNLDKTFNCENQSTETCLLIDWFKAKYSEYSELCSDFFINPNGKLGRNSKWIANLILEDVQSFGEDSAYTKNSPDFEKYCPKFKDFTLMQKVAFHTWIFELTAFPESSCNVNVNANKNAPTTAAVCMYQLENSSSIRAWRSIGFKPKRCAISYKEILTLEGCTGCAFDEYKRKIIRDGTPFGVYNQAGKAVSRSYWAPQNPLPQKLNDCYQQNTTVDRKTGRPLFLKNCKSLGANWEWAARASFFRRLPRFPLCGTTEADNEIKKLRVSTTAR